MGALVAWILFELSKAAAERDKHDVEHKNFWIMDYATDDLSKLVARRNSDGEPIDGSEED